MALPLMQKATAVWLLDNTTLTFLQISKFCGLHDLEVSGIADGEVGIGIKGFDPIANRQLTADEIKRCEADPTTRLVLFNNPAAVGEMKRKGPRYTPLSKRQDRPAAIAWLVKYHPELTDGQISKLVGTTKPTITSIRERTHWNIASIQPVDPVALGLSKQLELDEAVAKASAKAAKEGRVLSNDERQKLVTTNESLAMDDTPRLPSNVSGLEYLSFSSGDSGPQPEVDAESFFNLPPTDKDAEKETDKDE